MSVDTGTGSGHALCAAPSDPCLPFRLYENKGEADFVESLVQLFRSISDMMSSVSDQTVRVKVGPGVQQRRPRAGPAVRSRASREPRGAGAAYPVKPGLEQKAQEGLGRDSITALVVEVFGFLCSCR